MTQGDPIGLNFKGLEMQKWEQIELKRWMRKMGHLFSYRVYSQSYGHWNIKNSSFCIICWWLQKNCQSLGKPFKCIWKIERKCYELLDSEPLLVTYQSLKIKDFGIFCWLSNFSDISTINISHMLTPKPIEHTIFWKNSERFFRYT